MKKFASKIVTLLITLCMYQKVFGVVTVDVPKRDKITLVVIIAGIILVLALFATLYKMRVDAYLNFREKEKELALKFRKNNRLHRAIFIAITYVLVVLLLMLSFFTSTYTFEAFGRKLVNIRIDNPLDMTLYELPNLIVLATLLVVDLITNYLIHINKIKNSNKYTEEERKKLLNYYKFQFKK